MRTGSVRNPFKGSDVASSRFAWRRLAAGSALVLVGCSSQQLYGAGQAWQRSECQRIVNAEERNRCMQSTARSHDEYLKEAAAAKGAK